MKNYIKSILLISAVLGLFLTACDNIEAPYKKPSDNQIDTTKSNARKIFLEEFTGHRCGNCPEAAELAHEFKAKYPNLVVLAAYHTSSLANPVGKVYSYDFRTPEGNAIEQIVGEAAHPAGMINRVKFEGQLVLGKPKWQAALESQLNKTAIMTLKLNAYINVYTNELEIEVDVNYLSAGTANHYLAVYIVEDSIVKPQTDYRIQPPASPDVLDYVHNNVLRTAVNGIHGDQLSTGIIPANSVFNKKYNYSIPAGKDWRIHQLRIIAFVHDKDASNEILQVEETNKLIFMY
ncbi:MAG: Omp28-related outer membrane protein [Bacteroidota bacterium]